MYDLISLGTIAVDLYFKGDMCNTENGRFQLAVGGKYFTDYFHEGLGGGGANVAIGAHKHGLRTALIGKIGNNPFKQLVVNKLIEEGVSYHLCHFVDNYLNISSILLNDCGDKTVINYQTPHQHFFRSSDDYLPLIRARAVYMGNLPGVSLTERITVARFLHHHKIPLYLNFGVKDARRETEQLMPLLKHATVLILNGHEFADLVKHPYEHIHYQQSNVLEKYLPDMNHLTLIVTDGQKGSYGYTMDRMLHQKVYSADIKDSTGAGDGYASAFIASFQKTHDLAYSMNEGAKYASKILAKIGAN